MRKMEQPIDIYGIANWSELKMLVDGLFYYTIRTSGITVEFLQLWSNKKEELKKRGVSLIKKVDGELEIQWKTSISKALYDKLEHDTKDSRATDSTLVIPCAQGMSYFPYQKAGIEFAIKRNNVLIADEMGLGKTAQAIGVINYFIEETKKVLVICPASLKINWKRELEMWLVKPKKTQLLQSVPTKLKSFKNHGYGINKDAEVYIINYDILKNFKEEIKKIKWDVLILDEAHFCKSRKAIRTKIALSIKSKRKIFLTGTPIENRPMEIFTLLRSLDKPNWNDYFEFGKRYCNGIQTMYGWDFTGARRLDELQYKLRSTLMIRRKKVDVLKDLPPKFRQVIELPSDGLEHIIKREKTTLERKQSAKNAVLSANTGSLSSNDEDYAKRVDELEGGLDNSFDELSKARRETAIAKIPLVVEHLRNCYEANPDKKIVLFAYHREVIDALMTECEEWCPVKLYGGMNVDEKQESVDAFQKDKNCKLFIGNVRAAGVGLTLTKSHHVIFAELDWNPAVITQCEDRAHRIGQLENVLIQHLVLEGSVDSQMIKVIIEKQKIADRMLDKDHFGLIKEML